MDPGDVRFEEVIAQNPYSVNNWLIYLRAKETAKPRERYILYERAVRKLPRSYKLWYKYLLERTLALRGRPITDKRYATTASTFERALVHLHKMPRIWLAYTQHLEKWRRGTLTRKTYDRALQSLPVSQHDRIWTQYVEWAKDFGLSETVINVLRRYLLFDPGQREAFIDYLEETESWGEAVSQLHICLGDPNFTSPSGQTTHQLWMRLCSMCAEHPEDAHKVLDVPRIVQSGIGKFSDAVGKLWVHLATYHARMGDFEGARDVYVQALDAVLTVKDFSIVYDSYVKLEEALLTSQMSAFDEHGEGDDDDVDVEAEMNLSALRLEFLIAQREVLLTAVRLRQNRNNCSVWYTRAELMGVPAGQEQGQGHGDGREGSVQRIPSVRVVLEALRAVDPMQATGGYSRLWLALGWFFDAAGQEEVCRLVFKTATGLSLKTAEEASNLWCEWAEWELAKGHADKALRVMQQAIMPPRLSMERRAVLLKAQGSSTQAAAGAGGEYVHKTVKVWEFYLDLEEQVGTVDTTRAAYDQAFASRILTPSMAINYARFLRKNQYFEDAFKCFERAIDLFEGTFPHCKPLWEAYLSTFMARYSGAKMERLRNLFEQALDQCPVDDAPGFYVQYALAEEQYGLARHCTSILERAARVVNADQQANMWRLCVKKTEKHFGPAATRTIYERAISLLGDNDARSLCEDFAAMETALNEIDRARAIYTHASQFADPRYEKEFWAFWRAFEEGHGNEDTFREMLRVRRSVETAKVGSHRAVQDLMRANVPAQTTQGGKDRGHTSSASSSSSSSSGTKRTFVSAGVKGSQSHDTDRDDGNAMKRQAVSTTSSHNVSNGNEDVIEKSIPADVYGSALSETTNDEEQREGALARFKK